MISIAEAKKIIEENLPPKRTASLLLEEAFRKVLAEDVFAPEPSPRYTNSAMDGFGVRWEDVAEVATGKSVELQLVGESSAGNPFRGKCSAGEAIRISTGAMLPDGADTVIPQEDTEIEDTHVKILKVTKQFQNVRFEGEEFREGALLLKKGCVLQPAQIGLLASLGISSLPVFKPPQVSIIVTGSELVPVDSKIEPWQIRDSNSLMLKLAVMEAGGEIVLVQHVGDDPQKTRDVLQKAARQSDILIFSGGVSVGPHDFVKEAAGENGFKTLFWKVRQKPGKPLFFAKKNDTLLFGLPGNPVSAYMCYLYYIKPVIEYLYGRENPAATINGQLAETLQNHTGRDQLFRVWVEKEKEEVIVHPVKKQGSHMLSSLTRADGFILLKSNSELEKGRDVEVILF